eukprot:TRINITY_DN15038_c0_g1_i1.p1 TRINITY_DN15038_c0_g1~~TRINITY_DN15038_c0_g1_i1.p1  ORF type:complete len:156 (-),score=30.13 TRINITY_DN15038_c0_g1_i1:12-479(-)
MLEDEGEGEELGLEVEEEVDLAAVGGGGGHLVYQYEFHIAWSSTYAVPCLYFNGYGPTGKLLAFQEILDNLPEASKAIPELKERTFITQLEHPVLGRPFFGIHPCQTSKLLGHLLTEDDPSTSYLLLWFSTVAPLVGLRFNSNWVRLFSEQHIHN